VWGCEASCIYSILWCLIPHILFPSASPAISKHPHTTFHGHIVTSELLIQRVVPPDPVMPPPSETSSDPANWAIAVALPASGTPQYPRGGVGICSLIQATESADSLTPNVIVARQKGIFQTLSYRSCGSYFFNRCLDMEGVPLNGGWFWLTGTPVHCPVNRTSRKSDFRGTSSLVDSRLPWPSLPAD